MKTQLKRARRNKHSEDRLNVLIKQFIAYNLDMYKREGIQTLYTYSNEELKDYHEEMDNGNLYFIVHDNEIAGFTLFKKELKAVKVDDLFISHAYRNLGIGRNVLQIIEDMAKDAEKINLNCYAVNTSNKFYKKVGFKEKKIVVYKHIINHNKKKTRKGERLALLEKNGKTGHITISEGLIPDKGVTFNLGSYTLINNLPVDVFGESTLRVVEDKLNSCVHGLVYVEIPCGLKREALENGYKAKTIKYEKELQPLTPEKK